jgi:hypothetical protein
VRALATAGLIDLPPSDLPPLPAGAPNRRGGRLSRSRAAPPLPPLPRRRRSGAIHTHVRGRLGRRRP